MELLFDISPIEQDTIVRDSIAGYNATLYCAGKEHANIKIIDFADFTNQYSKKDLVDWKYFFISQMGINPRLSRPFSEWFEKKLSQIALKRKKCLILDLDNTLWGGVLGEDGKVDLGKVEPISYDSVAKAYRVLGEKVGKAFSDGKQLL
jgi:predicted enzyme involved in methoxymalonyl-ACP biosynthesis